MSDVMEVCLQWTIWEALILLAAVISVNEVGLTKDIIFAAAS